MSDTAFKWLSLGAGGYATGISFSDDGLTRLLRTDGNGFVWVNGRWQHNTLADSVTVADTSVGGVDAIAVAPSNGSIAYLSFGNTLFKSTDGGKTWPTDVLDSVTTAPNDDFRMFGPRLVVDPSNPNVVYYGSRKNGLYYTRDGGTTWTNVSTGTVPAGLRWDTGNSSTRGDLDRTTYTETGTNYAQGGVLVVAIDRNSPVISGRHQTVYADVYGQGIYQSTDGGTTWALISGSAALGGILAMVVAPNGDLFTVSVSDPTKVASNTLQVVSRWHSGTWTTITPPGSPVRGWTAVACDPVTTGRVIVIANGGNLATSTDYGTTWTRVTHTLASADDIPWLAPALNYGNTPSWMSPGEIKFDPVVAGRVWLTEGIGLWYADLTESTNPIKWHARARGMEQLVVNHGVVPPGGKPQFACWDRPLFRSVDPGTYPATYGPTTDFGAAWDIDWSLTNPDYLVASVASQQFPSDPTLSGYSTDGGVTWTRFPTIPLGSTNGVSTWGMGAMAVSTPGNVVWCPAYGKRPYYTKDGGTTWTAVTLPGVSDYTGINPQAYYIYRHPIAADRQTSGTFYLFHTYNGIFKTTDGGDTWTNVSNATPFGTTGNNVWHATLKAAPSTAGLLYWSTGPLDGNAHATLPFKKSTNGGTTWTSVSNVTGVEHFGYGKPIGSSTFDTIYIVGYVSSVRGVYRSTDGAATWTLLASVPANYPRAINSVAGDPNIAGRVYLTTNSGVIYGDLATVPTVPPGTVTKVYVGDKLILDNSTTTGITAALAAKADLVSGKLDPTQVPDTALVKPTTVASQAAMLALTTTQVQIGDVVIRSDGAGSFMLGGDGDPTALGNWNLIAPGTGTSSGQVPVLGTGGRLAMARLASGTPDGTQFVRDDGTLAVPSGGGGGGSYIPDSFYRLPTGGLAATFDRMVTPCANFTPASGTLYLTAIVLRIGTVVTNLNCFASTTAFVGVTHSWMGLFDTSRVALRLSADNTSTPSSSTVRVCPMTSTYTVPATGLYFVGTMWAAGTMGPILAASPGAAVQYNTIAPPLHGISSTGQTTPPAEGTTMAALSNETHPIFAWVT